jgi:hypothetical protein
MSVDTNSPATTHPYTPEEPMNNKTIALARIVALALIVTGSATAQNKDK